MAIKTLASIASVGASEAARVAAAIHLLDRGFGKAEQAITGELTGNIQVVIRTLGNSDDDATLIDVTPNAPALPSE